MKDSNKQTIVYLVLAIVVLLLLCTLAGCVSDGNGGYRLSTGSADRIEKGLDAGATGAGLISLFIPGAAVLAGAAAGVAGAFKKLKPELTKQKATAEHVVTTIEQIKKDYPETWFAVKDKFKENTNADIDEVIEQIIVLNKQVEDAKIAG